jgi:serine/threonine protein kinase
MVTESRSACPRHPSNLLVTRSGNLKVIDFGIAEATSNSAR